MFRLVDTYVYNMESDEEEELLDEGEELLDDGMDTGGLELSDDRGDDTWSRGETSTIMTEEQESTPGTELVKKPRSKSVV